MTVLGGIGFTAPWLLLGLIALPILWLILRAVPPAPIRRRFPGVALMLGLKDDESVSDRTPWWLLLLRMLAVAALILGLAGPVLNPDERRDGDGPLLILMDAGWAGASRWPDRIALVDAQLTEAGRAGRTVALVTLAQPEPPVFQAADVWRSRLAGLSPQPWTGDEARVDALIAGLGDARFDTHWISDGLDHPGRDRLLAELQARGDVRAYQTDQPIFGLAPPRFEDGAIRLTALRPMAGAAREVTILAIGRDPAGTERVLSSANATFDAGGLVAETALVLPAELRGRLSRFEVQGQRSAGATTLSDDSLRRREVALISAREDREGLELLSPLHYLEQALIPSAELLSGSLQ
ncbi:MAG: LytTR family transcriptional regulator, partial [Rhodobacteraceae bacterium]